MARTPGDPIGGKTTFVPRGKALIPSSDRTYLNLATRGMLQVPIYTELPTTWDGSGFIALKTGTQFAPVYAYYQWDGNSWVQMTSGGTIESWLIDSGMHSYGEVTHKAQSNAIEQLGLYASATAAVITGTLSSGSSQPEGLAFTLTTGAAAGNDAGIDIGASTVPIHERRWSPALLVKFAIPTITNIRMFIGFSAGNLATSVGADDPAAEMVGLQFSTDRPDTNFQFVHDGGTQVLSNTGVAPVIDTVHFFKVTGDNDSSFTCTLYDAAFAQLATATFTTDIPASGTDLGAVAGLETRTAATRALRYYIFRGMNRIV